MVATCHKLDQDRRDICQLGVGNTDVGLELLRRGLAWVLMRYAHELSDERRASCLDAQAQAKSARIGLCSADVTPVPPWEWRGSGRRLPGEGVAKPAAPPANAW